MEYCVEEMLWHKRCQRAKSIFETPDFYMNLKGIYYHMNPIDTPAFYYPTTHNFVLMLEIGIGLNRPFVL